LRGVLRMNPQRFKERLLDLLSAGAEARAGHLAIRACKCIVGCGAT
jgi:hypothetical protein